MKPLPKSRRILSLVMLFVLFVFIAPILISYSMGYRFDDALDLIKTGGIYVHSETTNARVYVDGKVVKNNGVFLRNTYVKGLRPNLEYKVEVQKDGLNSYVKSLKVYPSLVTEVRPLMLPTEIETEEVWPYLDREGNGTTTKPKLDRLGQVATSSSAVNNSTYDEYVTLFDGPATSTEDVEEVSSKNATNTVVDVNDKTIKKTATSTKIIPDYFKEIGVEDPDLLKNLLVKNDEASWIEDGNTVIYWIGKETNIPYYYCEGHESCRTKISLDWMDEILRFDYLPGREDVLVVLVNDGIFAVEVDDRSERNIQTIYKGNDLDFRIDQNGSIVVRDGVMFYELRI